jgi:hypothetical protein
MFNIATSPKPAAQALLQDGLSLLQPAEFKATVSADIRRFAEIARLAKIQPE